MNNDAFENRRLAVMEEDHAQQQQESRHCADGHNDNPTPMMVLVHNSSNGAPLILPGGRFRLVRRRLELRRYVSERIQDPTDSCFLTVSITEHWDSHQTNANGRASNCVTTASEAGHSTPSPTSDILMPMNDRQRGAASGTGPLVRKS